MLRQLDGINAQIDNPVGAISVDGTVGLLVLLLVPITNPLTHDVGASFSGQIIGALTIFVWVFVNSLMVWLAIKYTIGVRLTK